MIGGFHLSILRAGAGAVALAVSLAPRVSYADSDEEPSFQNRTAQIGAAPTPALVADEVHWYGWQPLIVDGVSTALIGGGTWFVVRAARTDTSASAVVLLAPLSLGALGYLFGAPTIHWIHGRLGAGFASLGLRVAAPLAGLGVGALISGVAGHDNTVGALIGLVSGAGAAIVVDDAFIARETVVEKRSATLSVAPSIDGQRRGGGITFSGTF
jgi:hypothetical protein